MKELQKVEMNCEYDVLGLHKTNECFSTSFVEFCDERIDVDNNKFNIAKIFRILINSFIICIMLSYAIFIICLVSGCRP